MVPYLSRIEGPPPKRNVARSNRAGIAKKPVFEAKSCYQQPANKSGRFSFSARPFCKQNQGSCLQAANIFA